MLFLFKKVLRFVKRKILKYKISKSENLKIVIGAGNTRFPDWISTDKEELDTPKEADFFYFFSNKKIDNILLEHVVEHILYTDFIKMLEIVKKFLKNGAVIRIAVPDKYHPSEYVRKLVGVRGQEPGAEDHKYFYCIEDFEKIAKQTGYKLVPIEYFDKEGYFHTTNYDFSNGFIFRCSKNYKGRFTNNVEEYVKMISSVPQHLRQQFFDYGISYTSLIVDLINE